MRGGIKRTIDIVDIIEEMGWFVAANQTDAAEALESEVMVAELENRKFYVSKDVPDVDMTSLTEAEARWRRGDRLMALFYLDKAGFDGIELFGKGLYR